MALSCMLGLAACLSFGGSNYTLEEALGVLSDCDLAEQVSASEFVGPTGMGIAASESLDSHGLTWKWPKGGTERKGAVMIVCRQFRAAYHADSQWKNIDKLPGRGQ